MILSAHITLRRNWCVRCFFSFWSESLFLLRQLLATIQGLKTMKKMRGHHTNFFSNGLGVRVSELSFWLGSLYKIVFFVKKEWRNLIFCCRIAKKMSWGVNLKEIKHIDYDSVCMDFPCYWKFRFYVLLWHWSFYWKKSDG